MTSHSMKPVAKAAGAKSRPTITSSIDTMRAEEKRWRAEDAMRDLMRAEDHKKDKGLMSEVKKMAQDKIKKMSGLCGKGK